MALTSAKPSPVEPSLRPLIKAFENMFLIKRRYSVVNNRQYISLDTNIYGGSVGTVKVGVLDQVGNQYRTKRFIHPDREGTGQMQTTTDFMLSVYIVIKRLPLLDQGNEIDVGALRKLTVIYLGKQQQRFIQPDDMVERTPHLNNFARRFLVQVRTIEQILHTSAKYSQRSLQLVRGIAYKLFLTLEQLLRRSTACCAATFNRRNSVIEVSFGTGATSRPGA